MDKTIYVRKANGSAEQVSVKGEKRLTATERESLIRLNVAAAILGNIPAELSERMELIPYAKRDMAMMAKKADALLGRVKATIPEDQERIYDNSLRMASYTIGVRGPGGSGDREKDYGMWISYGALNAMLDACHDHCLMCSLDKYACKKCALRKALDTVPNDVTEDEDLPCKYRAVI